MTIMFLQDHRRSTHDAPCSRRGRSTLNRTALATATAARRARAEDIEADMGHACERAALEPDGCPSLPERRSWDRQTWDRYVVEAVRQAHAHAVELETLRRGAAQLDRLAGVS